MATSFAFSLAFPPCITCKPLVKRLIFLPRIPPFRIAFSLSLRWRVLIPDCLNSAWYTLTTLTRCTVAISQESPGAMPLAAAELIGLRRYGLLYMLIHCSLSVYSTVLFLVCLPPQAPVSLQNEVCPIMRTIHSQNSLHEMTKPFPFLRVSLSPSRLLSF